MPAMMRSIRRARSNTASYYADNIKSSLHGHRRGRSFGSISSRLRMGGDKRDTGVVDNLPSKAIDTSTTKIVDGSGGEYTPLALLQVTNNDDTSSETASEDDSSAENQPKSMQTKKYQRKSLQITLVFERPPRGKRAAPMGPMNLKGSQS